MAVIDRTAHYLEEETPEKSERAEKTERLEARVTREEKELFRRAAAYAHQSLTDFAVTGMLQLAQQIIREHEVLTLSLRDAQALMEVLNNPGPTPPKLIEAAERYKAFMGEK